MPYQEIQIGREVFISRIPPSAVYEWLNIRERNRVIGYPDRPPDVDTPLLRAWVSHPNEINEHTIKAASKWSKQFQIYTFCADISEAEVKLLVSYEILTKQYLFRRIIRANDGTTIGDKSYPVPEEDIEEAFDRELEGLSVFAGDHPYITTYFDYEELESEVTLAEKEIDDYYGTTRKGLLN
jgi:hypothetical protein